MTCPRPWILLPCLPIRHRPLSPTSTAMFLWASPGTTMLEVDDPNSNQDISYLLSESTIPNLTISRRGRITWTPTEADLGPQSIHRFS